MAEHLFVRLTVDGEVVSSAGVEACPVCGATTPLVLVIDSDDWSLDPVDLLCPAGHSWPAAGLERWMLAQIVVLARVEEPDLDEMIREFRELPGH